MIDYRDVLRELDGRQWRSAAEVAVRLGTDDLAGVNARLVELVNMGKVRSIVPEGRRMPRKFRLM